MSRLVRFVAALSMVAMLTAMAGGGTAMAAPGNYPAAQTTLPAEVLQYQWVLEYFSNEDKSAGHDMTAAQITLKFAADETLSGSGGCNNYSGTYTVSGQQMTISKLASTQKACEQAVMDNETKYLQQLSAVNAYNVNNSKLELTYASGTTTNTMTFIPGSGGSGQGSKPSTGGANSLPSDILTTTCTLQYIINECKSAGQDLSTNNITIKFAPDGTVGGSGGCNSYSTTYTVSNLNLTISDKIITTAKACEQAVMDRET